MQKVYVVLKIRYSSFLYQQETKVVKVFGSGSKKRAYCFRDEKNKTATKYTYYVVPAEIDYTI
jgi:hypothetical protein